MISGTVPRSMALLFRDTEPHLSERLGRGAASSAASPTAPTSRRDSSTSPMARSPAGSPPFFVKDGGRLRRYDLLKGKLFLMVRTSSWR
ncbi:MAG TPA: hypothetical protein VFJ58_09915 [Armatimonadota bacterium]|nr:hypothetical protein [Armatimonadota bacterium]